MRTNPSRAMMVAFAVVIGAGVTMLAVEMPAVQARGELQDWAGTAAAGVVCVIGLVGWAAAIRWGPR